MRGRRRARSLLLVLALVLLAVPAVAGSGAAAREPSGRQQASPREMARRSIQRLRSTADGQVTATFRQSTGVAGFVRVSRGGDLLPASGARPTVKTAEFFSRYGDAVGVTDARQLRLTGRVRDAAGGTHLIYDQVFRGVAVFGAQIRAHLDAEGRLTAVNGTSVPRLRLSTTPRLSAARAAQLAIREVVADPPQDQSGKAVDVRPADLRTSARLVVYRTGLIRDVAGTNQLAYRVEVTDGAGIRDLVFVHAHVGKVLNRYSTVEDALFRRLFEQNTSTQVWQEGDP
ncbi:MAG TPA: hypothetical protein VFZ96_03865, partial [Actinomycetota bacterium]|nr:hypothetical protein [Actinomycetota bacterium]